MTIRRTIVVLAALFALAVGNGCALQSYPSEADKFYSLYQSGRAADAADVVVKKAESKADSRDALLWRLEEGTVLLAAGRYPESLKAFEAAEDVLKEFESRATVSGRGVLSEGAALVTNQTAIPYSGTAYDRIMLNTYKALAYLRDRRPGEAQVELRRAYERQQEAVERYEKDIAAAEADAGRRQVRTGAAAADPALQRQLSPDDAELDKFAAYAVYVNPFTVYLDGLVFLATGSGGGDLERAKKDFERVKGMVNAGAWLDADLAAVDARYANATLAPAVYVVVENGMAPKRREIAINVPIPAEPVLLVSVSFPVLTLQPRPYDWLEVRSGDQVLARTEVLASMDAVIAREFKHDLPLLIIRTILSTVLKTAGQYGAEQLGRQRGDPLLAISALLAAAAYGAVTSRADLRSWLTLPKEFQFARLPRPLSGELSLTDGQGNRMVTVELPDAELALVYVKVPSRGSVAAQVIKLR